MIVAVAESGLLSEVAPVVDSGLAEVAWEDGPCESGLHKNGAGEVIRQDGIG